MGKVGRADTAGILLIGDEILSGKVIDENGRFLIEELRELGVALKRITVLPDLISEIADAAREFSSLFEYVFTSGGVGPTHDDVTMAAVARAFDTELARNVELERMLRDYYGARLEERNLRMADLPRGAELLRGPGLDWPVIAFRNLYILPGVPDLFRRKFLSIRERFRSAPYHLRSVYVSADEGHIAGDLDRIVACHAEVQVGSYPKLDAEYRVKVTLESKDAERVQRAADDLVLALGAAVVRVV